MLSGEATRMTSVLTPNDYDQLVIITRIFLLIVFFNF